MDKIPHIDGKLYHHQKNKNNSVWLVETETNTPLVEYTTDYKVLSLPKREQIGKISFDGDYLVFLPVEGKPLKPWMLRVTPENILEFHQDISNWWLNKYRSE